MKKNKEVLVVLLVIFLILLIPIAHSIYSSIRNRTNRVEKFKDATKEVQHSYTSDSIVGYYKVNNEDSIAYYYFMIGGEFNAINLDQHEKFIGEFSIEDDSLTLFFEENTTQYQILSINNEELVTKQDDNEVIFEVIPYEQYYSVVDAYSKNLNSNAIEYQQPDEQVVFNLKLNETADFGDYTITVSDPIYTENDHHGAKWTFGVQIALYFYRDMNLPGEFFAYDTNSGNWESMGNLDQIYLMDHEYSTRILAPFSIKPNITQVKYVDRSREAYWTFDQDEIGYYDDSGWGAP